MARSWRWLLAISLGLGLARLLCAQDLAPAPCAPCLPASVVDDEQCLLELGKLLLGHNNPVYGSASTSLTWITRNVAGDQATSVFTHLVKLYPQSSDGWLWLGVSLIDSLRYPGATAVGQPIRTPTRVVEAVAAFRTAYQLRPTCLLCVSYYGDALMEYGRDFDGAHQIWERYWQTASTSSERTTALTQLARASLNKAYFGHACNRPPAEVRAQFLAADGYVRQALQLSPRAAEVKEMQQLLQQYRKSLYGE